MDIYEKNPKLVTIPQFAEHRGISRQAVHKAIKSGRLDNCLVAPTLRRVLWSPALWAEIKGIPRLDIETAIKNGRVTYSVEKRRGKTWLIPAFAGVEFELGSDALNVMYEKNFRKLERLLNTEDVKMDRLLGEMIERRPNDPELERNLCLIWEYLSPKKGRGDKD